MSVKPFYPSINLGGIAALLSLRQQMEAHADYLSRDECPYDEDTKDNINRIMAVRVVEVPVEVERIVEKVVEKRIEVAAEGGGKRGPKQKATGVDINEVAREIEDLRAELRQLKIDGKALQTADKIQLIKLRSQLVEKLVTLAERTTNVKTMSGFMSTVMTILDDLLEDDGRSEFMRRIEPFAAA